MTYIDIQCDTKFHVIAITLIILLASVLFIITQMDFVEKPLFVNLTLISSISATMFTLLIIFKHYAGARNIRMAYMYLFIAYSLYLQGEVTWFVYETVFEVYPYPSVADVGYFFYFMFTTIFLITTIRCFSTLTRYNVGHAVIIMAIITSVYLVLSIEAETDNFDLVYALPFILTASSVFAFALVAVMKLKNTSIGLAWIIIFVSILLTTVSDIWYYILENVGVYTYDHIMNTMWIISDVVLIYALVLHRRII